MARRTSFVKNKAHMTQKNTHLIYQSIGVIDLHFHGAFGIDCMTASIPDLQKLSSLLWKKGIAGFCPTTVTASQEELLQTVNRLGNWIRRQNFPGAKPLGIHLEGPFIHPESCGAHARNHIRRLSMKELYNLWEASQGTLKILTLAPETLSITLLKELTSWSRRNQIHLSIGHSQSSEKEASHAFQLGFQGITHAWNALPFHHRNPGAMGAALGKTGIFVELIIDQIHVSPTLIDWTLKLHSPKFIYFISDCLSAGGIDRKTLSSFEKPKNQTFKSPFLGDLKLDLKYRICRTREGHLAGGGDVLSSIYCRWLIHSSRQNLSPLDSLFIKTLPWVTQVPLKVLKISKTSLLDRQVQWIFHPSSTKNGKIHVIPIDSVQTSR